MQCAKDLSEKIGRKDACAAVGVPRSSLYRAEKPRPVIVRISPRALSAAERDSVRDTLNSPRYQDLSPREVYATLLDEDKYLCSWRSRDRVLDENGEVRERRDQLRHPNYAKPELLATSSDAARRLRTTSRALCQRAFCSRVFAASRVDQSACITQRPTKQKREQSLQERCSRFVWTDAHVPEFPLRIVAPIQE